MLFSESISNYTFFQNCINFFLIIFIYELERCIHSVRKLLNNRQKQFEMNIVKSSFFCSAVNAPLSTDMYGIVKVFWHYKTSIRLEDCVASRN